VKIEDYPRLCGEGHLLRGPQDRREGRCLLCRVSSKRRYEQSVKGRAVQARYNDSVKGRDRSGRYEASTKGIVRRVRAELRSAYAALGGLEV
jgi:DNA-directed RNA polymerase beta subunit